MRRLQTSAARLAISAMANSMRSSSLFQTPKRESGRHLESNIASMQSSRSKKEFKTWLRTYATHLASESGGNDQRTYFAGAEKQLRELCEELLGSLSKSDKELEKDGVHGLLLGMKRRDLLRDVAILPREQWFVSKTIMRRSSFSKPLKRRNNKYNSSN